jgi:hypothetical protein
MRQRDGGKKKERERENYWLDYKGIIFGRIPIGAFDYWNLEFIYFLLQINGILIQKNIEFFFLQKNCKYIKYLYFCANSISNTSTPSRHIYNKQLTF